MSGTARRRPSGGLLAAATLAAALASAAAAEEIFELGSFRRRFLVTPQGAVVAHNDFGDLRVRTAARHGLVVSAMIQKVGTADDELEIRIEESAERVLVEVVPRVARPRGRVDLTLMVPPGKRIEGATNDGLVEVKYRGEVRARSRRGAITIDGALSADAASDSGEVVVRLAGG